MKKLILILAGILAFNHFSNSQIGINTPTPDSSAAIDIQSPASENRGALLPRMTKLQRLSINSPATSLLVFDTDEKIFYYYDSTAWVGLLPKENPTSSLIVEGDLKIDVGSVRAPNVRTDTLLVPGFSRNALVPTGAIIMWSGSVTNLPVGWALCDGNMVSGYQTPNLKGRFIVGYDPALNDYDSIRKSGGDNQVVLVKSNLPKHQHVLNDGTDQAVFSTSGDHRHSIMYESTKKGNGAAIESVRDYSSGGSYYQSDLAGNHQHTGITGDGTSDQLNAAPFDNSPPYFVLAYIIKLP